MDSLGVESYLKAACTVLSFDVGELWVARRTSDASSQGGAELSFVQLYTSPSYHDFKNHLLRPNVGEPEGNEEARHRFSPLICRCVLDGGQIVWANTRALIGLVGKKELPLNSAIGFPISSVGEDLCIMVLFAVQSIPMTPTSIEFLLSLGRAAASSGRGGFLKTSRPVTVPRTDLFVGLWHLEELLKAYSNDVEFNLFPLKNIEALLDMKESKTMLEFFAEFKKVRNVGFQPRQLQALQPLLRDGRSCSEESNSWLIEGDSTSSSRSAPSSPSRPLERDGGSSNSSSSQGEEALGSSTAYCLPHLALEDMELEVAPSLIGSQQQQLALQQGKFSIPIDSRASYRADPSRFHELMIALLGLTVFDACELWLVSDREGRPPQLYVAAALNRDKGLERWTTEVTETRLLAGEDVPGQVLATAQPFWDNKYSSSAKSSRSSLASELGIITGFGVPLPGGSKGVSGVLALYSKTSVEPEPLLVSLVSRAAQIISAAGLDSAVTSSIDIESIVFNPTALVDWVRPGKDMMRSLMPLDETVLRVNTMGSLSMTSTNAATVELCQSVGTLPRGALKKNARKRASSESEMTAENDSNTGFLVAAEESTLNTTHVDEPAKKRRSNGGAAVSQSLQPGSRRCEVTGCGKCAQGATQLCISHGGGRRCTVPGCFKGARDKLYCAAHGGGKRCGKSGCTKSAVGGSGLCTAHGGGKRCQVTGCDKSSQGATPFCVKHGGGRKCQHLDGCTKVARGRSNLCARHSPGGAPDGDDAELLLTF